MKNIIIYTLAFTLAFVLTTGILFYLNESFANIFAMDFRDNSELVKEFADTNIKVNVPVPAKKEKLTHKKAEKDSLAVPDDENLKEQTVKTKPVQQDLSAELSRVKEKLEIFEKVLADKNMEIERLKSEAKTKNDSDYEEWLASTIKIYESMNTNKASQLLANMKEEEARIILYSMKKKKAAEILSKLSNDTVIRLTRAE